LGEINIDLSQMIVLASQCNPPTGTITAITVLGATNYQWINSVGQTAGTSLVINNIYPGAYVLIATNAYGCEERTDSIRVPLDPTMTFTPPLQIQSASGKCDLADGFIKVLNFPGPQNWSFRWIDSLAPNTTVGTSLNLSGINSGTYILFATNAAGCEQQVTKAHLPYQPPPVIMGAGIVTNEICNNQSGSIQGLTVSAGTGIGPFTYSWIDANNNIVSSQQNLLAVSAGNYTLIVKDIIGCSDTSSVLQVKNTIVQLNDPKYNDEYIRINTVATLTVLNPQQGTYLLFDSPVATVPIQQNHTGIFTTTALSADKTYYIQLVNGNCGSSKVAVKVYTYDKTNVFVPSGFTPNNDSKNDVLKVRAYGIVSLEYFSIYNKWGQLVFTTKDISKGWDGTVNGMMQSTSLFVWMVRAKDELTSEYIQKKGTVLLIR
jgi:gliding motility-associated-like protein